LLSTSITYPDDCLDIDVKMIEFDSIVKMGSADPLTRAPRWAMRASLQDGERPRLPLSAASTNSVRLDSPTPGTVDTFLY
jgi:hypothetical protein